MMKYTCKDPTCSYHPSAMDETKLGDSHDRVCACKVCEEKCKRLIEKLQEQGLRGEELREAKIRVIITPEMERLNWIKMDVLKHGIPKMCEYYSKKGDSAALKTVCSLKQEEKAKAIEVLCSGLDRIWEQQKKENSAIADILADLSLSDKEKVNKVLEMWKDEMKDFDGETQESESSTCEPGSRKKSHEEQMYDELGEVSLAQIYAEQVSTFKSQMQDVAEKCKRQVHGVQEARKST